MRLDPGQAGHDRQSLTTALRDLRRAAGLWAIWDGKPARGYGGTADAVTAARNSGLPVQVMWPDGALRD